MFTCLTLLVPVLTKAEIDPESYVAYHGSTGGSSVTLTTVPADKMLLITDILLGSESHGLQFESLPLLDLLEGGVLRQRYYISPSPAEGSGDRISVASVNLRLESPLVFAGGSTVAAELIWQDGAITWGISIHGRLIDPVISSVESGYGLNTDPIQVNPAPNPSNTSFALSFSLLEAASVSIGVYDVRGRQVRFEDLGLLIDGQHVWTWDGNGENGEPVSSGVYFTRVIAGDREGRITLAVVK